MAADGGSVASNEVALTAVEGNCARLAGTRWNHTNSFATPPSRRSRRRSHRNRAQRCLYAIDLNQVA